MSRSVIWVMYLCILLGTTEVFAQKQGNVWYFGHNAGIDFNSGSATALQNGALYTYEGSSSISDKNGNLLFYTDGVSVWNRKHVIMPNGTGLYGDSSTTQAALIVPKPGDSNIYYIFTVDAFGGSKGVCYSIVDISKDNGNGDITTKNTKLYTTSAEKICATLHHNQSDVWIVTHEGGSDRFISYLVSAGGVSTTAVITSIGNTYSAGSDLIGQMAFSTNGKKLVSLEQASKQFQILDFDNTSGKLSNPVLIKNSDLDFMYGVSFSPDGGQLYATGNINQTGILLQYSLRNYSQKAITASRKIISKDALTLGSLQIGPDQRIYVARFNEKYIGVINYPNDSGFSCNYIPKGVNLKSGTCVLGLPAFVETYYYNVSFIYQNTCFGEPTSFIIKDSISIDSVHWLISDLSSGKNTLFSNAYSSKYVFGGATQFQVTLEAYSNGRKDEVSKIVTINKPPTFDLGNDTIICPKSIIKLGIFSDGASVHWSTGSSADTLLIPGPGKYWVEAWKGQCRKSDTVTIYNPTPTAIRLPADTDICEGASWQINLKLPVSKFVWQDGARSANYVISKPGTYWVRTSNPCNIFADTIHVNYLHTPKINLGKDTTLCSGSAFYLRLNEPSTSYLWQDGSTEPAYVISGPGTYWVMATNKCFKYSDTVTIKQLKAPDKRPWHDTTICLHDSVVLNSKWPESKYLWQDNSRLPNYTVKSSGNYSVRVSNMCGSTLSSIKVDAQDCNCYLYTPGIFTPNNDGLNDSWQPSGCATLKYDLIIYNRWGERVFESTDIQSGWDGTIKGEPAPENQYMFTLFTKGLDKKEYHKNGVFYLVRMAK